MWNKEEIPKSLFLNHYSLSLTLPSTQSSSAPALVSSPVSAFANIMPKKTVRQKREERIKQIRDLGSTGAQFQSTFRHAWNLFETGNEADQEESEDIATELLSYGILGDLHRAGCRLIRAHGSENYL